VEKLNFVGVDVTMGTSAELSDEGITVGCCTGVAPTKTTSFTTRISADEEVLFGISI